MFTRMLTQAHGCVVCRTVPFRFTVRFVASATASDASTCILMTWRYASGFSGNGRDRLHYLATFVYKLALRTLEVG